MAILVLEAEGFMSTLSGAYQESAVLRSPRPAPRSLDNGAESGVDDFVFDACDAPTTGASSSCARSCVGCGTRSLKPRWMIPSGRGRMARPAEFEA